MRASVYFALTRVVLYSILLRFVISLNTPKRLKTAPTGSTSLADIEDIELVSSMRRGSRIGSSLDNAVTLVLNADYKPLSYMPLSIWNWQDSLRAVLSDKAYVVSEFEHLTVRTVSTFYLPPSVIVLKTFHSRPVKMPVMSRRNVYYRDSFCCQYCAKNFERSQKSLTLDHVIPRSKGGKLTWTNTVTACNTCNFQKGNTLPDDLPRLGMKLKSLPRIPTYAELQYKARKYSNIAIHPHWDHFL